jgi:asparagine synthase (glutamine-hydrolysing)
VCGICGVFETVSSGERQAGLSQMLAALEHRGPDGQGVHHGDRVTLGHARLSIIDLKGGDQPLYNEDRSVVLVCNGEIYNYRELRDELVAKGHRFRTKSDSEVLVHLWEELGPECVKRLRGMFAFVLYDQRQDVLFGARDHFGQKPLFYAEQQGRFLFGSEIKALLAWPKLERRLSTQALDEFLFYRYVPSPLTLIEGVYALPPGHHFTLRSGELRIERYWQPSFAPEEEMGEAAALELLERDLIDAVESHMVSDVPVGVFLSGGIDSSLMVAIASRLSEKRLRTFSISYVGSDMDEGPHARRVAEQFGTEHLEYPFRSDKIEECILEVASVYDQPLSDLAAMPLLFLSREAAKEIKVVITGDGGDELFGGYGRYQRAARLGRWGRRIDAEGGRIFETSRLARPGPDPLGLRRLQARLGTALVPSQKSSYHRKNWEGWGRTGLYQPDLAERVGQAFRRIDADPGELAELHPVNRMLRLDQESALPDDLLLKTDYATMAHGLEARAPFLDPELAVTAARLPIGLKVSARETKIGLRRLSEKWLPDDLVKRPKQGFGFPIGQWFRGDLHSWVRHCLIESSETVGRYFRPEVVETLLDEHRSGRADHRGRILTLLTFELWHREFLS